MKDRVMTRRAKLSAYLRRRPPTSNPKIIFVLPSSALVFEHFEKHLEEILRKLDGIQADLIVLRPIGPLPVTV
jgi:hypothetical protein